MSYRGYMLFAMETAGVVIILWVGVPIYRQILLDISGHEPRVRTLSWALLAVVLIQAGYCGRVRFHLGPQTAKSAESMKEYDPDNTWSVSRD